MGAIGTVSLNLPASLMDEVRAFATQDAVSVDEFLVHAIADAVAERSRAYFAQRAARAEPGELGRILATVGTNERILGDELPEGWPGAKRPEP